MNKASIVVGAILLVTGIVAAVLFGEVRAQRQRNAQLVERVEGLEAVRTASAGAPTSVAPVVDASGAATAATTAEPAGPSPTPGSQDSSLAAILRQTMNTEEGREFTRNMLVSSLARQYPDVGSELGLSAAQVDRLFEALARYRTEAGMDRASLLGGTADRATREEVMRRVAAAEQAHEAQLSQMLGADYPRWKEYQRTAAVRQQEEAVRARAAEFRNAVSAGRPLDDAQFEALRTAIGEEERRIQMESRGLAAAQQLQRLAEDQRRLTEVASRYLDAQQLQGYQRHLRQQGDMARMMLGAAGALGGGDAAGVPAAPAGPAAD